MTTQPGSLAIAGIEAAYADIRQRHPELPKTIMIITGSGFKPRGGSLRGSFTPESWSCDHDEHGEDVLDEIKVTGERMADGAVGVLTTLIHECVHKACRIRDIQDTSPSNRNYHNKKFLAMAEEYGLELIAKSPRIGFSDCRMTSDIVSDYEPTLKALGLALPVRRKPQFKPKGQDRNNPKAVCACFPERIIRASRKELEAGDIFCQRCENYFDVC